MNINTFTSQKNFWQSIGEKIKKISPQNICASGGSSAKIFDADHKFFSGEEKIFIADERFVPENHSDSNAKLLSEKFSAKNNGKIFSWEVGKFSNPEKCAQNYEKVLAENLPEENFDLTILGIGPDGHTASLFPNIPQLDEEKKKCISTKTTEFAIENRLSMSFSQLEKSKNIFILIMGSGKKEILEKIIDPKTNFHDFPARKIMDFKNVEIFFLDL